VKISELFLSIFILLLFVSASFIIAIMYPSLLSWTGAVVLGFVGTGVAASEVAMYRQQRANKRQMMELRERLMEER
jgi:uncharacterized membrane protein